MNFLDLITLLNYLLNLNILITLDIVKLKKRCEKM